MTVLTTCMQKPTCIVVLIPNSSEEDNGIWKMWCRGILSASNGIREHCCIKTLVAAVSLSVTLLKNEWSCAWRYKDKRNGKMCIRFLGNGVGVGKLRDPDRTGSGNCGTGTGAALTAAQAGWDCDQQAGSVQNSSLRLLDRSSPNFYIMYASQHCC